MFTKLKIVPALGLVTATLFPGPRSRKPPNPSARRASFGSIA
jgi:hypothetical protein